MSLKQLNKVTLVRLIQRLDLDEEGTKPILEERLSEYFDNHPELEEDEEFKKFVQFRKRNSPKKSTETIEYGSSVAGQLKHEALNALNSSPTKVLSIGKRFRGGDSSPSKPKDEEDDDGDDSESSAEEDEGEDDDVELIKTTDSETIEEETDPEYKPSPFEFVTKAQDWVIEKYEDSTDFVKEKIDDAVDTLFKQSNDFKKSLSTAESVNYLTSVAELGLLLYQQVPIIELKQASFIDQRILSRYGKVINDKWPIYDFQVFFQFKFLFVLFTWFLLNVAIPTVSSYYFNFISKKFKKTRFDPLIFNLVKLILAYTYLAGNVSFNDVKTDVQLFAEDHGLGSNLTFVQRIRAHLFHNTVTLQLILGNLPLINGAIGILIALYVAAI